jgi:hypothetical protein
MKLLNVLLLAVPVVVALVEDGVVPQPEALVEVVQTLEDKDRDLVCH